MRDPSDLTLVIGDKNLSSWSLRAWLALKHTGARFEEVLIPLDQPDSRARIHELSPGGKVPALRHAGVVVWESLAICEYLAELFPRLQLWPQDRVARAIARSVSNEMHAGFTELRRVLPMNIRARTPRELTPAVEADVQRIVTIWNECRERFGRHGDGPYLFGRFTIADAMYAPVVTRFQTYGVHTSGEAAAYCQTMLADPALQEWIAGA